MSLQVLLKADLLERLCNLAAPVVDAMGLADKSDHYVAPGRFVQDHLRMASGDDLALRLLCGLGEHVVDLSLAQDLQVRIRLIEQQHRARVGRHVCEQEQSLLLSSTAR